MSRRCSKRSSNGTVPTGKSNKIEFVLSCVFLLQFDAEGTSTTESFQFGLGLDAQLVDRLLSHIQNEITKMLVKSFSRQRESKRDETKRTIPSTTFRLGLGRLRHRFYRYLHSEISVIHG